MTSFCHLNTPVRIEKSVARAFEFMTNLPADLYHLLLSFRLQAALFKKQGDKECSMWRELWKFSVVLNITLALCALLNRLCNRTVLTNTFVVSYPSFASVQCHGVDCHCLTTCNITYNLYVVALSQFMPSKAFS